MFKKVDPKPNFVDMEKKWLKYWYENGVVEDYLHKNDKSKSKFSFMDGPITANNPMGIHHAWGRTLKDLWQRYNNMKGRKQRFQNGFDNQGLWVEVEVEKSKGFKSKKDIEEYGMDKFVEDCKTWTKKWAGVQTEQSRRLGYFMDWDNSYYTMSEENNYMIWTFLYKCWKNGWLYKGSDVLPWCPRCGTAISQHEILTGDYKDLEDETIFFKLPIKGRKKEYLLVWTTTPWTLPANVAVAVNPDRPYLKLKADGEFYYAAKESLPFIKAQFEEVEEIKGEELVGLEYDYPFKNWPSVKSAKPQYKVVPWELVGETEGTGMVHIAPGCGQEDHQLGKDLGLSIIVPINDEGIFVEGFNFLEGKSALNVAQEVFDFMKKEGFLFKTEKYIHRYPLCWRCKTKLLFRFVDEWYISMKELRFKMMEVAKKSTWIPDFGLERELDWLKNMHDWCISKKRYWGLALPIWVCDKCGQFEVIRDDSMLKERAVEGYDEFVGHTPHRPYIDKVKIKCSKCGSIATRIADVGNPWLDAGIVPYSTLKYRTDKAYWKEWFPADFVTEGFPGQFKNWFYSLIAMSTVLEDKEPFKALLGHANVLDEKGQEMHKSSGNAIEFNEAADKIGADVLRWVYVRHNPENDLLFGYKSSDEIRRLFYLMVWNVYKYLVTYAEIGNWKPSRKSVYDLKLTALDKWILSRLNGLLELVDTKLGKYDAMTSALAVEKFVGDLSSWYIRRSRDRFAANDTVAMEVLYHVVFNLAQVLMPFMPFIAEEIYQNLRPEKSVESVNLIDYPEYDSKKIDKELESGMELVRSIASLGLAARISAKMKVRQPLGEIVVAGVKALSDELTKILAEELNVRSVRFEKNLPSGENWETTESAGISVALNKEIPKELIEEGKYRELTRRIQNARKNVGLEMGEAVVAVVLSAEPDLIKLVEKKKTDLCKSFALSSVEVQKSDTKETKKSTRERIFVTI